MITMYLDDALDYILNKKPLPEYINKMELFLARDKSLSEFYELGTIYLPRNDSYKPLIEKRVLYQFTGHIESYELFQVYLIDMIEETLLPLINKANGNFDKRNLNKALNYPY